MQLSKGVRYTARSSKVIALTNHNGMKILLSTLGASWISCLLPLKSGKRDILLGSPNMAAQMDQGVYLGSIVGRVAINSITKSQFSLSEKDSVVIPEAHYQRNNLDNFSYRVWKVTQVSPQEAIFSLESPDGDQGFPGKLQAEVCYRLTDENEVIIRYYTQVNALCPVNLTNHAYFNLAGEDSQRTALEHDLQLAAAHYLPIDEKGLPTGEWLPVENSTFDFRDKKRIGYDFLQDDQQKIAGGYHHAMILDDSLADGKNTAASLFSPNGDVQMNIATTMPSIHFYTGNHLISIPGKSRHYTHFSGVALNTQFLPDAMNHPEWDERYRGISQPNKCYQHQTCYQFIF
ncbi:galactose-1-epimerase [Providencia sneebia]|uniref:Aldose 1-epimerase n=1 Tax=Providencia sneebia DSM 19967 TaxID=1141660 RepID=K8W5Q8_9GAMM|nr:galactose-1-epimerase [Providencia sneebia]EKT55859.1 galactose-1-epimerase [Providencia sneebia DSM 19967]